MPIFGFYISGPPKMPKRKSRHTNIKESSRFSSVSCLSNVTYSEAEDVSVNEETKTRNYEESSKLHYEKELDRLQVTCQTIRDQLDHELRFEMLSLPKDKLDTVVDYVSFT